MKHNKAIVNHWRYEDGWRDKPQAFKSKYPNLSEREFTPEIVGWYCWVYPSDDHNFENWMEQNMTGVYDCTLRFNSGNPMYTVMIKDDQDATLFKLTWM